MLAYRALAVFVVSVKTVNCLSYSPNYRPMILEITNQEQYSRGELLLRTLFGWLYIALPHIFILMFIAIASQVLTFIAFWVILFTGSYPESFFEFQVKAFRWNTRLNARLWNLCDGYPAFGLSAEDDFVKL